LETTDTDLNYQKGDRKTKIMEDFQFMKSVIKKNQKADMLKIIRSEEKREKMR